MFWKKALVPVLAVALFGSPDAALAANKKAPVKKAAEKKPTKEDKAAALRRAQMSPDLLNEVYVVLEKGTRSPEMRTRSLAVANIAIVKPETMKDYVEDALKDPQWIVRRSAIETLVRLGNPVYRTALARAIADSALYEGDLTPLPILSLLPRQEAVELLLEVVAKTPDNTVAVVNHLLANDEELAVLFFSAAKGLPALQDYALKNLEAMVKPNRVALLDAVVDGFSKDQLFILLEFYRNQEASTPAPFLARLLKSKDNEVVDASSELAAIRGDRSVIKRILPWCETKDVQRQLRCLRALRNLGTDKAVADKAKVFLYGDPAPEVLRASYDLLTKANVEEIYDRVYRQLNSTDTQVRAVAVHFLPRVQGNRALPKLHELLTDGNREVKLGAVIGLGELRQVESVPIIEAALFDETDPEVRREMVKALGNIADHSIIRVVSFLITDPTVKHEAVVALSKVPHRDALVTLENVLNNTYTKDERALALTTLVRISPAEAGPVLQRSLGWLPEDYVGKLAEELKGEALPLVVAALDSMNPRARLEAVRALRFMEQAKEMEILERELFATKHADIKNYTLSRLCELKGVDMLPVLESFFKDPDAEVRNTAMRNAAGFIQPGTADEDKLKDLLMDTNEGARVAASVAIMKVYGY